MPRKLNITSEQAYLNYFSMGGERSLSKLYRKYEKDTPNPPSFDTLKRWSQKNDWKSMVRNDRQLALENARDLLIDEQGKETVALRQELTSLMQQLLQQCRQTKIPNDPHCIQQASVLGLLVDKIIDLHRLLGSMPGGWLYNMLPQEWSEKRRFLTALELPKALYNKRVKVNFAPKFYDDLKW